MTRVMNHTFPKNPPITFKQLVIPHLQQWWDGIPTAVSSSSRKILSDIVLISHQTDQPRGAQHELLPCPLYVRQSTERRLFEGPKPQPGYANQSLDFFFPITFLKALIAKIDRNIKSSLYIPIITIFSEKMNQLLSVQHCLVSPFFPLSLPSLLISLIIIIWDYIHAIPPIRTSSATRGACCTCCSSSTG